MDYERLYTNLILMAKKREEVNPAWSEGIYTEVHHWYPRSMYPQWATAKWNLIRLTAKEHYIAHRLLAKYVKGKMTAALWGMVNGFGKERYKPPSRIVALARENYAATLRGKISPNLTDPNGMVWEHGRTQPVKLQALWSQLEIAYDWWIRQRAVSKKHSGARSLADHLGMLPNKTFKNMMRYMKKYHNGDWKKSEDYKNWCAHYSGKDFSETLTELRSQHAQKDSRPWEQRSAQKGPTQSKWAMADIFNQWLIENPGKGHVSMRMSFDYDRSLCSLTEYLNRFPNNSWTKSKDYVDWCRYFNQDKFTKSFLPLKRAEAIKNLNKKGTDFYG